MSAASAGTEIQRHTDIDTIINILGRSHPHVVANGWLGRFIERSRIESAIRSEQANLAYCLVTLGDGADQPQCGMLTAIPKPAAEGRFAATAEQPMLFGFLFGFSNQDQFDKVVHDAIELARERECLTLVGPFETTINYCCGLLHEEPAFPPGMMTPKNPLQWKELMSQFGFELAERLYTYEIDVENTPFRPIGLRAFEKYGLSMRPLRLPVTVEQREAIRDVINSGWKDNWGFVPVDISYVDMLVREFWPVLWDGLSWIVYRGDCPVGLAIATPDVEELIRDEPGLANVIARLWRFFVRRRVDSIRVFLLGLSSELHGSAVAASVVEMMIHTGKTAAERYRAKKLIVGWTLSSNRRINRMIETWAPDARRLVHSMWTLPVSSADGAG